MIREANEWDREEELKRFDALLSEAQGTLGGEAKGMKRGIADDIYAAACRLLGVAPDAPYAQIAGAYRVAMARHHPDRNGADGEAALRGATDRAQELNRAFGIVRQYHNR